MAQSSGDYELLPIGVKNYKQIFALLAATATGLSLRKHERYIFVLSVFVNALALGWIFLDAWGSKHFVRWQGALPTFCKPMVCLQYEMSS